MEALATEFLSASEVKDLTGRATPEAQAAELTAQGLPFKRRGSRVLVSRWQVREWLAGKPMAPSRGPRLELVR